MRQTVADLQESLPEERLKDHEHFAALVVAAQCTGSLEEGRRSLTGSSREGGIDAIVIDRKLRKISLFQTKYRKSRAKNEPPAALNEFVHNSRNLLASEDLFLGFVGDLEEITSDGLREARNLLENEDYELDLYFVTPWKFSSAQKSKARREAQAPALIKAPVKMIFLDDQELLDLFEEWEVGASPPVQEIELHVEDLLDSGNGDYACFVSGDNIARAYDRYGSRLFNRNIRGFLSRSSINKSIQESVHKNPDDFLSSNKGITIVASAVESRSRRGKTKISLRGAQIVDGQQTTRCLAACGSVAEHVMVRVHITEQPENKDNAPRIHRIVEATNSQNTINKADLRANDQLQVDIERELAKHHYWYERKRGDLGRRKPQGWPLVRRNHLLTASALLEGISVSSGLTKLWDDPTYKQIFDRDPLVLLARWCLWMEVRSLAQEKESAEATWAKNAVYTLLGKNLQSVMEDRPDQFRQYILLQEDPVLQATDILLQEAHNFYQQSLDPDNPTDVQVFFKSKDVAARFEKFFTGRPASRRKNFSKIISKITKSI